MGQLRFLFLSLLVGFASCGTLSLNATTTTKATPEPTVTAGTTAAFKTPEPTVTAGTTKTAFPSSTTTTRTTTTTTTAKPLTTNSTTSTTTSPSPAPWFVEEEKDFADDQVQAQAPIEQKLPTSGCKAAAFSSVLAAAASGPSAIRPALSGILSETLPSSLPRREKIFVRIPTDQCPPEIMRKTMAEMNNLRQCQGLGEMKYSSSLAEEARQWASETASKGVVYKPNYSVAGQYATSTAAPYAVFSLDLTAFDVMAKWKGSGNNYLPWFTGSGAARHFSNDEWKRVKEFGVGCAAYRYKTAKAMFWTVVFFRKA